MSRNELVAKIEALNEWEAVIEEAKAEAEAIRDAIKAEMMERDTEELTAGQYIVRWTSIISNRFDTTSFKRSCRTFTKPTPSPFPAAALPSAHKKRPLPDSRPKQQARGHTQTVKERARTL